MTPSSNGPVIRRTITSLALLTAVFVAWIALAFGSDALAGQLPGLAIWIPLGIFGLIRWTVWLSRKVPALLYRPITAPYRTSASIVVPVYQEDPEVFKIAMASWKANHPDELIVVVDRTDEACQQIVRDEPKATLIVTDVPGKRDALARGIRRATSEVVVLVDSDTVFNSDVLERVLRPFADPSIGGVGTRQQVLYRNTFWQRIAQIYLDIRYDVEAPALTTVGRAVSCLSGRTAAYRRSVVMPLLDDFLNERFLGKLCVTGEDKRLTSLVLRAGYDTYHQGDAVVWSTFAPDFSTFIKQRIRWTRNTYRSDLRALWDGWVWQRPYLAFMLVDRLVSPYALLIGLAYFSMALAVGQWPVALALAIWWLLSRGLKLAPHFRRDPRDLAILPAYVVLTFVMAAVKVYALATVHHHRWLTRNVEVIDGEVVRGDGLRHDRTAVPVRAAGAALVLVFALFVGGLFVGIGGFAFTEEDTGRPVLAVDAPIRVSAGEATQLIAQATDRFGGPLQFVWTLDGTLFATQAIAEVPLDLAPGEYQWAVHVRDSVGNTSMQTGRLVVVDGTTSLPAPASQRATGGLPSSAPEPVLADADAISPGLDAALPSATPSDQLLPDTAVPEDD